jgi:hypothetical protein
MFGKKRKKRELEAQVLASDRKRLEQLFDEDIKKAEEIKDPALKVMELKSLESQLTRQIWGEEGTIYDESTRKERKAMAVGTGVSMTAAFGTLAGVSIVAPPVAVVAIPVAMVGMLTSAFVSGKRGRSTKEYLEASANDHIANLEKKSLLVQKMLEKTITDNVAEISESVLYKDVLGLQGVSGIFAMASAKHIKTAKEEAAQKETLADDEKSAAAAPRKRQTPSYNDLNGL